MGLLDVAKTMIKDAKKIGKKVKKSTVKGKKSPRKKSAKKSAKKGQKKTAKKKLPKTVQKRKPQKTPKRTAKSTPEKEIGVITHYFDKITVGIIKLKAGLKVGDRIHIKGAHDDFVQVIKSMQLNHQDITRASKGNEIGIKVTHPVHENNRVYKVKGKG